MKQILYIILLIPALLQAQYTLQGKITETRSGEPVAGVIVMIPTLQKGTQSDIDGLYKISGISQTEITVVFSAVGYKERKLKLQLTEKVTILNIKLDEKVFELDEVILSTAFNKLQKDNVVKVAHKSISAMEKQGIQNLMQGISQIPGVTSLETGTGISKPVIRGLTGNRVLVFNQGVRMENFQFGEKHGMGISEDGIESIEVIKGPASLLYGSDAMGGVLYLQPEKYAPKNKFQAQWKSKYFSNTNGFHTGVGIKQSYDKLKWLARGSYNKNSDYQIPDGQRALNTRYQSADFKTGLAYKTTKSNTDFRYNYNRNKNGLPTGLGQSKPVYIFDQKHQDITNHNFSLKNNFKLQNSKLITKAGYTRHTRILQVGDLQKIGMQLNTLNLDGKWYLPRFKSFESIIGSQVMLQTNRNFGVHYLIPDAQVQNYAVFSTANYQVKKTQIQAGVRYDFRHIQTEQVATPSDPEYREAVDKKLHSFTGSLGFKTEPVENLIVRLNVASGFRAPNLSELTSKGQHDNRIEIGNSGLQNEQNIQTDFNIEYHNTHIEVFANAFYNQIKHYIYLQPVPSMGMLPVYQYQQSDAFLYGGEAGMHLHPHPLDWLHYDTSFEMVTGQKTDDSYLPLIPANKWKNTIRFTNNHKHKSLQKYYLSVGINHTFAADKVNEFEDKVPAYTLINTSLGAMFQFDKIKMDLNLSVHNLTNQTYTDHLSALQEQGIPNQGRNIILTLNIKY